MQASPVQSANQRPRTGAAAGADLLGDHGADPRRRPFRRRCRGVRGRGRCSARRGRRRASCRPRRGRRCWSGRSGRACSSSATTSPTRGHGFLVARAVQPDADFRAVVAAEDRAVLDEGDLQAEAGGGERGAGAGDAAAGDDEVILAPGLRFFRDPEAGAAEGGHLRVGVGRSEVRVASEQDRVAAALEAGEVVQCEADGALRQIDGAAVLPVPLAPTVPKVVGRGLPLMRTWNLPGVPGAFHGPPSPWCGPIRGSGPLRGCRRWWWRRRPARRARGRAGRASPCCP
jgi:hypothetical protein